MTRLDADLVRRKLVAITRKLEHLKSVERLSLDEYRADLILRVLGAPAPEARRSFLEFAAAVETFLAARGV